MVNDGQWPEDHMEGVCVTLSNLVAAREMAGDGSGIND
jgi:hypothetical protein